MSETQLKKPVVDKPFVTQQTCNQRYFLFKWVLGAILLLMTVFVVLVSYSSRSAAHATEAASQIIEEIQPIVVKTRDLESDIKTHQALQEVRDKVVLDKLAEIQSELLKVGDKQDDLYERVLTNHGS